MEGYNHKHLIIKMKNILILCFIVFIGTSISTQAQNAAQINAYKNVNINSLSDAEIKNIIKEMESRGLTVDQAAAMAQAQGASPKQINDLKRRILEYKSGKRKSIDDISNKMSADVETTSFSDQLFSEKAKAEVSGKNKKIYGFNLFNSKNLTFEPSVNIPNPENYVIGIGDELLINVWGDNKQTYQLLVEKNGAVMIPDMGPIFINGMNFSKAQNLIKNQLKSIYDNMKGEKPSTWANVTISNIRAININVTGEVIAPGTYKIPSTATAFNALYLSGGPNENGSFRNIKLLREGKVIKIIDVYDFLLNGNPSGNIQLRDQDIIFIPTYNKRVEARGTFKREGFYELKDNEKLSDLIRYAGGFIDAAYKYRLSVTKFTDKQMKIEDVFINEYKNYIPINGDIIKADSVVNRFINRVKISGAVYRPGEYQLTNGLTLSDLIKRAEGVKEEVFSSRGVIVRKKKDRSTQMIAFNVLDIINGEADIELMSADSIAVRNIFEMREEWKVQIFGEVQTAGEYDYHENMTLKDLVFMAGGLKESASNSEIEISRRHNYEEASKDSPKLVNTFQTEKISRDLKLSDESESFVLKPFDNVFIRRAPSYNEQQTVSIEGEILYPGTYPIKYKNERISDLLKRAGGFTEFAHKEGAKLIREYRNNEIDLSDLNMTSDTLSIDSSIRELQSNILELNIDKILENPGSIHDYPLREGDRISIPLASNEVRVIGEVLNPIGLAFEKRKGLMYYIGKTGGFTTRAKRNKIYVLYANGTTKTTKGGISRIYPQIEPGCQIIIPSKPPKVDKDNSSKWLAFASVLSSLALTFATIFK